jgi:hypothetical protein
MSRTSVSKDVLSASALAVIANLTADAAPDALVDSVGTYDSSAAVAKKVLIELLKGALPRSYLAGGGMTNGTDATNDVNVAAGEARDSTNAVNIRWSALVKQLDAAWAVGTAAGGRDTGAIANGTWHVYAIRKDSDGSGDILFSISVSAPTMPAGYTYFRRIGSILRESAAIVAFVQDGDRFRRLGSVLSVDTNNPGTSAVTATLHTPVGVNVIALINAALIQATGATETAVMNVSDLASTDEAPSESAAPLGQLTSVGLNGADTYAWSGYASLQIRTNTSAQVRYRLNLSTARHTARIATLGWIDRRDRDL